MAEQTTERPPTEEVLKGKNILIVDDKPELASLLAKLFTRKGALTKTAPNGVEALKEIEKEIPNLILTDKDMPEMDGPGLIRRLRENPNTKDIPIAIMSGGDDFASLNQEEIQEKALSLQANAGIAKPFNLSTIVETAGQLLSQK